MMRFAGTPFERSLHVAALVDGLAVLAGQRAIVLRPQALRGNRPVAAVREHRREGGEAAARRPVTLRDHGDRIVKADDALDTLDLHRRRGIDGGELAAMDGCRLDRRVEHPGQLNVDAVLHPARDLGRDVEPWHRPADDLVVLRLLEARARRYAELGGLRRQLAVARRAAARGVADDAVGGGELACAHLPTPSGGLDQHRAGGGADDAQADLAGEAHRRGAARDLQVGEARGLAEGGVDGAVEKGRQSPALQDPALGQEAVGECLVARRPLGAHARPVGVELLGQHHGERGVRALAHVDVRHIDRDRVVGRDLHPAAEQAAAVAGDQRCRLCLEGVGPDAIADRQPARRHRGSDQKVPALHRPGLPMPGRSRRGSRGAPGDRCRSGTDCRWPHRSPHRSASATSSGAPPSP